MQALKRLVEAYLGVPAAGPGEGTAWHWRYAAPWPAWMPKWAALVLLAALLLSVVWVYRRDARRVSRRMLLSLVSLRVVSILLLLALLTQLSLSVDRTGLPVLVVMIDDSSSMGLEDDYSEAADRDAARSLAADLGPDPPTRLNLARSAMTRENAKLLKTLQSGHKLRVYRFSETSSLIGRGDFVSAGGIDELVAAIDNLQPTGNATRPGPALRSVLDDLRGTPPTAVIILTDGIASVSDTDRLSAAAELARTRLVPVYPVGFGSDQPARDVDLYDLLVDDVAFVAEPLTFAAKLKAFGYEGEEVTVSLKTQNSSQVLASTTVRLPKDGVTAAIELPYAPPEPGDFDFVLEVPPFANERNEQNNSETRHVRVRSDRIRLLLADQLPRWEFRALKQLLERESTIELHTFLQDADIEYAAEDRTGLEHFPIRRDQLLPYDVVILGDMNPADLGPSVMENLRHFVAEAAGGLILIAGERYNPWTFRDTPLEDLLPVRVEPSMVDGQAPTTGLEAYPPELTVDGRKGTQIFWFSGSGDEQLDVWNSLPPFTWLAKLPELKPGARVLLQHRPKGRAEQGLPIIVVQPYGGGRVLFHATDELWRWRFRVGDLYYGRYWVQAIRYLSRSKLRGQDRTAELVADRLVYRRGDRVMLRVRFLDERLAPAADDGVTVMVERRGESQQPITLTRLPRSPSVFEGHLTADAEGTYHAWVLAPAFKEAPPAADFRVEASLRELDKRNLDRADLQKSAEMTHGSYLSLSEIDRLPASIPPGHSVPLETQEPILLWNRWEMLLLFTSLLMCEWILRKRQRLI